MEKTESLDLSLAWAENERDRKEPEDPIYYCDSCDRETYDIHFIDGERLCDTCFQDYIFDHADKYFYGFLMSDKQLQLDFAKFAWNNLTDDEKTELMIALWEGIVGDEISPDETIEKLADMKPALVDYFLYEYQREYIRYMEDLC